MINNMYNRNPESMIPRLIYEKNHNEYEMSQEIYNFIMGNVALDMQQVKQWLQRHKKNK